MVKIDDGLNVKETEHYKKLGKFMINMRYLEKNKLIIKYLSYAPIPNLKQISITDKFKNLIIDLFDTNEINYQLLKSLDKPEIDLFKKIIDKSGLAQTLKFDETKTKLNIDELKNRFNVLRGVIVAGNVNSFILDELKEIVDELYKQEAINRQDYLDLKDFLNSN